MCFPLTEDDACLLFHPSIEYLSLSWVDISSLAKVQLSYFRLKNLHSLYLDEANYTEESLDQLIQPSTSMVCVQISHNYEPRSIQSPLPCPGMDYIPLIAQAAGTLQVLKLRWLGFPQYIGDGIDLRTYRALKVLALPSQFLLGDYNKRKDDPAQLIANRLPPNIKKLILEDGLSKVWKYLSTASLAIYETVPPKAVRFIGSLIEQKEKQTSSLDCILVTCCSDSNMDFPKFLYRLAEKHKIQIGIVDRIMDYRPLGWLDEE